MPPFIMINGGGSVMSYIKSSHLQKKTNENYLSWDVLSDRDIMRQFQFSPEKIVVFDEVHKFKSWRNLVKA